MRFQIFKVQPPPSVCGKTQRKFVKQLPLSETQVVKKDFLSSFHSGVLYGDLLAGGVEVSVNHAGVSVSFRSCLSLHRLSNYGVLVVQEESILLSASVLISAG
jgi:hypothetical protein